MISLKDLDTAGTEAWAAHQGLEPYRGRQIRRWLLVRLARSFEEMTDLPKSLRTALGERAAIGHLEPAATLVSTDGTRKYLFRLGDGALIESVLIPERDHFTLCVSSQCGCAMACRFCMTGRGGFKRNLTPSEIIDQVIEVKRQMDRPDRLTNIVFMGMGEPLANYGPVTRAIGNMVDPEGMNVSHRKVTLSTCGLTPQLRTLPRDVTVNLAISLNAADNETRDRLMPINHRYPLEDLISACRELPLPNRRMITFEYILIRGVNDRDRDAHDLFRLLKGIRAKVNLIPLNPFPGLDLLPPDEEQIRRFQEILLSKNLTAIIRRSKGSDIMAACGQLSGTHNERS